MENQRPKEKTKSQERKMPATKTALGEERVRLTVYMSKAVIKELKHVAVDEEKDVSELTETAIVEFLRSYRKKKS